MLRTPVLLSEALLAHDVYVCLECASGALPPEVMSPVGALWRVPTEPRDGQGLYGGAYVTGVLVLIKV